MAIPPVFLYNVGVVNSFPKLELINADTYFSAVCKVQDVLEKYETSEDLISYVTIFFERGRVKKYLNASDTIPQLRQGGMNLASDAVIRHMDKDYFPTAWIIRNRKMVPLEFLCEDNIENGRSLDYQYLQALWAPVMHAIRGNKHEEEIIVRHVEGIIHGALGLGAFATMDNEVYDNLKKSAQRELLGITLDQTLAGIQKLRDLFH